MDVVTLLLILRAILIVVSALWPRTGRKRSDGSCGGGSGSCGGGSGSCGGEGGGGCGGGGD